VRNTRHSTEAGAYRELLRGRKESCLGADIILLRETERKKTLNRKDQGQEKKGGRGEQTPVVYRE